MSRTRTRAACGLCVGLLIGLLPVNVSADTAAGIYNYHAVDTQLATSGHLTQDQANALADDGFDLVINLATVSDDHNASDGPAIAAQGVTYVHIPVPWDAPSLADLDLFFAVMDGRGKRKTLVHCMANYRASAFVYLYRTLRLGVAHDVARQDLNVIWDNAAWEEYPQWRALMDAAQARTSR